jgi:hypothetical protein
MSKTGLDQNDRIDAATKRRGADPHVPHKPEHEKPNDPMERKLEQGLEESMAGSDPVSVAQPAKTKIDKRETDREVDASE